MKENLKKTLKSYPLIKSIVKSFYFIYKIISDYFIKLVSIIFWLKPIQNNKIVICNYFGKGYGDNGKYIAEEIIKQNLDYDIVWLLKKDLIGKVDFPEKIRVVKYKSFKALYEMATAKIWIDNCRKSFYPLKRKGQYYIQTWHSPLRLKKIEKDAVSFLPTIYIKTAIKDSKNIDLMISGCDFSWNIYRNSFWYNGEIIKIGTPRCDLFFKEDTYIKEKVRTYFGLSAKTKIILFAPTFRKKISTDIYLLEYEEILKLLKEKKGEEWVFLVRLHPNVSFLSKSLMYNDKIYNATDYEDMQELLFTADILITDYSSSMFDMAIARKPVFLHCKDVDEYLKNERELYFNLKQLPFIFSKTDNELLKNISLFNEMEYCKKLDIFFKEINLYETGNASKQLIERIKEITKMIDSL